MPTSAARSRAMRPRWPSWPRPGSGKTTVLTRRIAYRIESGQAEPRHIAALTFTRDAAGELRRRLRRLDIHESIEAGTFHSIALRLLRDRAVTRNESMPSLAPDRQRLVRECLKELRLELDPYPAMTDIDWARARRIEPADYERQSRAARRRGVVPPGRFVELAAAYERLKRRRGVVDFDDLLDLNLRAVATDEAFRALVHWRFRHFFVDEAQDLNPLQHALLEAWRGGRADICLVGDPRQAIYGWNGSDHTTMTEVERVYPGVTVISLKTNYRCSPQVVSAGAAALSASGQVDDTASNRAGRPAPAHRVVSDDRGRGRGDHRVRSRRAATTQLLWDCGAGTDQRTARADRECPRCRRDPHATCRRSVAARARARRRLSNDQPRSARTVGRRAVHPPRPDSATRGGGGRPLPDIAGARRVPQLGRLANAVRRPRHRGRRRGSLVADVPRCEGPRVAAGRRGRCGRRPHPPQFGVVGRPASGGSAAVLRRHHARRRSTHHHSLGIATRRIDTTEPLVAGGRRNDRRRPSGCPTAASGHHRDRPIHSQN